MSAIAGVLYLQADSSRGIVDRVLRELEGWGPDATAHWLGTTAELGCCVNASMDEGRADANPATSPCGRYVLTWDGRLDNRRDLLSQLVPSSAQQDVSDQRLVLLSHQRWGDAAPERLLGDFAYALWDETAKRLVCVRDAVGARPFFFVRTGSVVAFASFDEALLSVPGVAPVVSRGHVASLLVPQFDGVDSRHSWLGNIEAIGAGETIVFAADGSQGRRRHFEFRPESELHLATDEAYQEAFEDVFTDAVRCRLRASGDIGVLASGGLDSGSTLAVARQLEPTLGGRRVHAYSAVADEASTCTETQAILAITRGMGDRAHRVTVPSFDGIVTREDLLRRTWGRAHPIDNSLLLPALLCEAAARQGRRVMLTGVCGDLAMHGGYPYIIALAASGHWRQAWRESRAAARNHTVLSGQRPIVTLMRSAYAARVPTWLQTGMRRLRHRGSILDGSFVAPGLAARMDIADWEQRRLMTASRFPSPQSAHLQGLAPPYGIASSLGGYQRVAGPAAIEIRDPWADRRVLQFWLRLPLGQKFRHGWTKYLLRRWMAGKFPDAITWRVGKEHVGWHFFRHAVDESHGYICNTIEQMGAALDNWVAPHARSACVDRLAGAGHEQLEQVFDVATLAAWLHRLQLNGKEHDV